MRQTWSSWYRTPVRYSMRSRTRLAVHTPLANPNVSGPRLSARSRSRNWAGLSLGGRPVRLAWRRTRTSDCSSSRGGVAPDLAFNTAANFTTNTNWQAYGGESTMSYFTQMAGLVFHNFVSAAAERAAFNSPLT